MGFSTKAKKYFYEDLGLNNRKISEKMDNYSESLVSRYMNSDVISGTFINKIKKFFPAADIAYLINNDQDDINDQLKDGPSIYKVRSEELIEEIEVRLKELKKIVSRR